MPPLKDVNYCSDDVEDSNFDNDLVEQMSGNSFFFVSGFVQRNNLFDVSNNNSNNNNLMPVLVQCRSHDNHDNNGVDSGNDDTKSNNNSAILVLIAYSDSSDKDFSNEDIWKSHLEPENNLANSDVLFENVVQDYSYNDDNDGTIESNLRNLSNGSATGKQKMMYSLEDLANMAQAEPHQLRVPPQDKNNTFFES